MHRARAEIERYGLRLTQRTTPGVDFSWHIGGTQSAFPLVGDEFYELERVWYELIAASRRVDPDRSLDEQHLSNLDISVAEFLDSLRMATRTRRFFETWARLGSGALSDEWSALQLLAWIAALDYSVLGYYADVSQYLEFGTRSLLDAMVADGGFDVELSTPVVSVRDVGGEVIVGTAAGGEYRAGDVVVTVPVNVWDSINFGGALTDARANLARERHPGRMQKVWIHARGVAPNAVALGDATTFLFLSAEYVIDDGVLLVGFVSPPSSVDLQDRRSVSDAVHEIFPGAEVVAVESHDWSSDPWARGSWMVPRPGWLSARWSEVQTPAGRVHFAGSDIATRWVGWIDGAIETASRAAAAILAPMDESRTRLLARGHSFRHVSVNSGAKEVAQ
jgi:monoamine oxidase